MSLERIKTVIDRIHYYDRDYKTYTEEEVSQYEQHVGTSFPDDFKWYMRQKGNHEIEFDYTYFVEPQGDFAFLRQYEQFKHPVFFIGHYDDYLEAKEGYLLPYNKDLYLPFSSSDASVNGFTKTLFISLNEENRGSVWSGVDSSSFDDTKERPPVKLADSFSDFLELLGTWDQYHPIVQGKQEAWFYKLSDTYLENKEHLPTTAPSAEELILRFFNQNEKNPFVCNAVKLLEHSFLVDSFVVESIDEFNERAHNACRSLNELAASPSRSNTRVSKPVEYEARVDNYYVAGVESVINDELKYKEEYLTYRDTKTGHYSLVNRQGASIEDVKVKGLGTFVFRWPGRWELKRKKRPAWSEIPSTVSVEGNEDALKPEVTDFIKEALAREELRSQIEAFVFEYYSNEYYPAFLDMSAEEQEDEKEWYPEIRTEKEIWLTIGDECDLYFEEVGAFRIHFHDWVADQEHGLDLVVRDWKVSFI